MEQKIKFIDLFAGIGGIRKGFELACEDIGLACECVFTSEIKDYAIKVLNQNHPEEKVYGDITKVSTREIPDFDFLLAGFPCQAFSCAGKRLGFEDTRGTLFFEVARILKDKRPKGFILENVEGLVSHDKKNKQDKIGNTLSTILETLASLNYSVSWKVLNAKDFGVAQDRKRIYILGTEQCAPNMESFEIKKTVLKTVLQKGLPCEKSPFIELLLKNYRVEDLIGKSVKDKRGGENNIHSWDISYKGEVSEEEKKLLNTLLKERRKKQWAQAYNIDWMDGMPLTEKYISGFFCSENLHEMLTDLTSKGYLKYEYPKKKVGNVREYDTSLPKGYNIVTGKMSFEVSKILDPESIAPTLVAMDMVHLYVVDGEGIRKLSLREGLRLFGYPEDFVFNVSQKEGYDLLGNTVVVPVIRAVASRVLQIFFGG